jgi:ubiquinone/menaquinone biosynthesis C-methylase UbiE
MGCGKGRNCIWLAEQGVQMSGFDFSATAIRVAKERAVSRDVAVEFSVMDATKPWTYADESFDFGIDCTASTDIENEAGRTCARREMQRVLKPGGTLLVYAMSSDDEYHKEMVALSPAEEQNAFYHPKTGKFEKVFDEEELDRMHTGWDLLEARRIPKTAEFFGKTYTSNLFWRVYQKRARQ